MMVKHTQKVLAWDLSEMNQLKNLAHTGVKDWSSVCSFMYVVSQLFSHAVTPVVPLLKYRNAI
jgi:hypothetical protein